MDFRSVKSATAFIKDLRDTRGFSQQATVEWRRITMRLSDCRLIQFARRLAACLEDGRSFLIGLASRTSTRKSTCWLVANIVCYAPRNGSTSGQTG